jgi:hypothetical protein
MSVQEAGSYEVDIEFIQSSLEDTALNTDLAWNVTSRLIAKDDLSLREVRMKSSGCCHHLYEGVRNWRLQLAD